MSSFNESAALQLIKHSCIELNEYPFLDVVIAVTVFAMHIYREMLRCEINQGIT